MDYTNIENINARLRGDFPKYSIKFVREIYEDNRNNNSIHVTTQMVGNGRYIKSIPKKSYRHLTCDLYHDNKKVERVELRSDNPTPLTYDRVKNALAEQIRQYKTYYHYLINELKEQIEYSSPERIEYAFPILDNLADELDFGR